MKINISKLIKDDRDQLLTRLIVHAMTFAEGEVVKEFTDKYRTDDGIILDIKLTANDRELNLNSFVDAWQKNVNDLIKLHAKQLVEEKMTGLIDLIDNIQETVSIESSKIIDDWEIEQRRKNEEE
jgi:hypothetical protein